MNHTLLTLLITCVFTLAAQATEGAQAHTKYSLATLPVACVEDIAPSTVADDYKEKMHDIATTPKTNEDYLYAWMYIRAAKTKDDKVKAVYDAADMYGIPPAVLTGAMMQESIFDNLPLTSDFGNWACGMGQINVSDWCNWGRSLSAADKLKIDWPQVAEDLVEAKNEGIDICDESFLKPDFAKPFHSILMSRLSKLHPGEPEFMLDASYATNPSRIEYSDVKTEFDGIIAQYLKQKEDDGLDKTADLQESNTLRFEITRNFIENCLNEKYAVPALAINLKSIFDDLPKAIREAQQFASAEEQKSSCMRTPKTTAYPLKIGWLLADAVYNAGDEILPGVYAYQRKHRISWENFSPEDLIHAIDYSLTLKNEDISAIGRKEALDHIRGVVNAVTIPGQKIVK